MFGRHLTSAAVEFGTPQLGWGPEQTEWNAGIFRRCRRCVRRRYQGVRTGNRVYSARIRRRGRSGRVPTPIRHASNEGRGPWGITRGERENKVWEQESCQRDCSDKAKDPSHEFSLLRNVYGGKQVAAGGPPCGHARHRCLTGAILVTGTNILALKSELSSTFVGDLLHPRRG
jgi:hypothetical protein